MAVRLSVIEGGNGGTGGEKLPVLFAYIAVLAVVAAIIYVNIDREEKNAGTESR